MGLRGTVADGEGPPMSEQSLPPNQPTVSQAEEEESLPWFTPEPPKPPERYRREEALLWVWRVVLVIAIIPALVLAYVGAGGHVGFLSGYLIDEPDFLPAVQFGLMFLIGAEMVYYFYLSWSFRHFRDWGLVFWAAAVATLMLGALYPVG